ncbi:MAG: tRNA (adenosine(37)-N6)-dimethylallyltransferase MiaA, partial [Clostridia bacterium]|nr:tRNA (adenosine(37)-N6)-dimethylallyltransferase MiaA [Clostridia bacterium]
MTGGKVIVIVGPTASGKTRLAVDLAKKYDGEVISADSVSVYKSLDVGSAKPTEEEKRGVEHYMIDVADVADDFSVSDYERLALPILQDILSRGKTPIICGGTGFYVNSLLYELSYGGASANLEIREKYEDMAKRDGKEAVWRELEKVDEQTAEKLHPNDLMRVVRALEIYYSTGRKKSEIKDELSPRFDSL